MVLIVSLVLSMLGTLSRADEPGAANAETKVCQIIIRGTEWTPDRFIIDRIALYPGTVFTKADLRAAEADLARFGLDASVTSAESESEFKDIVVDVKETPLSNVIVSIYCFLNPPE